jgi:hypothetical protein
MDPLDLCAKYLEPLCFNMHVLLCGFSPFGSHVEFTCTLWVPLRCTRSQAYWPICKWCMYLLYWLYMLLIFTVFFSLLLVLLTLCTLCICGSCQLTCLLMCFPTETVSNYKTLQSWKMTLEITCFLFLFSLWLFGTWQTCTYFGKLYTNSNSSAFCHQCADISNYTPTQTTCVCKISFVWLQTN